MFGEKDNSIIEEVKREDLENIRMKYLDTLLEAYPQNPLGLNILAANMCTDFVVNGVVPVFQVPTPPAEPPVEAAPVAAETVAETPAVVDAPVESPDALATPSEAVTGTAV